MRSATCGIGTKKQRPPRLARWQRSEHHRRGNLPIRGDNFRPRIVPRPIIIVRLVDVTTVLVIGRPIVIISQHPADHFRPPQSPRRNRIPRAGRRTSIRPIHQIRVKLRARWPPAIPIAKTMNNPLRRVLVAGSVCPPRIARKIVRRHRFQRCHIAQISPGRTQRIDLHTPHGVIIGINQTPKNPRIKILVATRTFRRRPGRGSRRKLNLQCLHLGRLSRGFRITRMHLHGNLPTSKSKLARSGIDINLITHKRIVGLLIPSRKTTRRNPLVQIVSRTIPKPK